MNLVRFEIGHNLLDILTKQLRKGSIGIASGHAVNLVLALVLQLIELACGDGAPIVADISIDGSLANTVSYAAAASLVVGLTVSSTFGFVRSREWAVIEGNHLCCRMAQVVAFIGGVIEALLLVFVNHLICTNLKEFNA
jgi:hypothetical protein